MRPDEAGLGPGVSRTVLGHVWSCLGGARRSEAPVVCRVAALGLSRPFPGVLGSGSGPRSPSSWVGLLPTGSSRTPHGPPAPRTRPGDTHLPSGKCPEDPVFSGGHFRKGRGRAGGRGSSKHYSSVDLLTGPWIPTPPSVAGGRRTRTEGTKLVCEWGRPSTGATVSGQSPFTSSARLPSPSRHLHRVPGGSTEPNVREDSKD